MALALPWLSMCLFSGLSDRRSILHGGVASLLSRIFSCRWSGWLLDEYLRACQNTTIPTFTSAARLLSHTQCISFYCNENTPVSAKSYKMIMSWHIRINPKHHPLTILYIQISHHIMCCIETLTLAATNSLWIVYKQPLAFVLEYLFLKTDLTFLRELMTKTDILYLHFSCKSSLYTGLTEKLAALMLA